MGLSFTEMIAAVAAANMLTVGFVAAVFYAQKTKGFTQPWMVWAGLMLPLVLVILALISSGSLPTRSGG